MGDLGDARQRLQALLQRRDRVLLGIVGAPGAGKSTLAELLIEDARGTGVECALVPMDGFHLAQSVLEQRGLAEVKGAPQTFDAAGYVALLARLRSQSREGQTIWAPEFDRSIENAVAGAIPVEPSTRLVITEGNYLLHSAGPWTGVRPLLDQCWYLDVDDDDRRGRLIARHELFGRSPESARAHAYGSDEANATLVRASWEAADLVVRLPDQ